MESKVYPSAVLPKGRTLFGAPFPTAAVTVRKPPTEISDIQTDSIDGLAEGKCDQITGEEFDCTLASH